MTMQLIILHVLMNILFQVVFQNSIGGKLMLTYTATLS